ncbi:hypothetical protein N7492_002121 [Penicillium capsulatum]|uniref:HAUS augmin-like complex subunit 3 N-terminal domain-containing protein n=1 Tax=Penicillium capsulatum TaxID=69766 RepID=A0A9W9IKU3_9EURO|nr:hypothetical protein N7492_002121 [Penicillium capsulatum]
MNDPVPLVDELLSTFKARDISVKREAIESALADPTTGLKNAEWVSRHVQPETLLSREELTLYTKLENSGALNPILRDPEFDATRPFLEDDLRIAIKSLETSTVNIQKQSKTLSQQCETLKKQLRRQGSLEQDRVRDIARLRKKHEAGRQNTTDAVNELSDELEASFRSQTDKNGAESKRILSSLSTRLKQDDKTLARLETLVSGVKSSGNDAATVTQATNLSSALAGYSAEEIHYRLDRLYLETLQAAASSVHDITVEDATINALEEELESLYPEIEVLAEIFTKQQFHEPILREIHHEHSQLRVSSQQRLEQVLDVIVDMTLNKQSMTRKLADRESSCELLEQLASLYQSETASQLASQPSSRRESLRRRSLQAGVFLAANREPAVMPEQPALENLLRRIGVSPKSVLRPRTAEGGAHELHEKRLHMSETLQRVGISVDSPLVARLTPTENASQLLASSLHANSHFETSLRDPWQEEALSVLETELASLQKGVQGLNLDVLHQRDKLRDKFLERWC